VNDDAVFTTVGAGLADTQLVSWFFDESGYGVDDVELSRKKRALSLRVSTGEPGRVTAKALAGSRTVGSRSARVGDKGKVTLRMRLRTARRVTVKVTFKASSGAVQRITLRR
jgi:hypothetical protein